MLKVVHKGKELLSSADFIAFDLGETMVEVMRDEERLAIIFDFVKSDGGQAMEFLVDDSTTLRVKCTNWDSPFPTTLKELAEIGDFAGRRLFLIFSAAKIGATGEFRQLHISVYLGDQIDGKA